MKRTKPAIFGRFFLQPSKGNVFLAAVLLVTGLVLTFSGSQSLAQTRESICRGLLSELSWLDNQSFSQGNGRDYRRYDDAVRKQGQQIRKAERSQRKNGCIGIFKRSSSRCRSIDNSLKRMQDNLVQLRTQRDKLSPQTGPNAERRRRVLLALDQNRCNREGADRPRQAAAEAEPPRRRTLLEQIFGVRTFSDRGRRQRGDIGINSDLTDQYNTFRSLCVRKSDGYYFPISFSTYYERLEIDEELCLSMCPGADVALYYHRMPVEDSEDMISYRHEIPYASEPFAFQYRQEHIPGNRCRFSLAANETDARPIIGNELRDRITGQQRRPGYPTARRDMALSPGDRFDLVAGLGVEDIKTFLTNQILRTRGQDEVASNSQRKVRIVGPAFFPVR